VPDHAKVIISLFNARRARLPALAASRLCAGANNLGFVFFKQQKYKEAARWFENTLKIDPSRAIAYRNLGDACVKSEDKDCARKAFKTYLELAPTGSGAEYVKQELGKL